MFIIKLQTVLRFITSTIMCIQCFAGLPGQWSVTDFGAAGNGKQDDTEAFQKAISTAGKTGGIVWVPSVGPGQGYVLSHTVHIPSGVILIGSPSGMACNSSSAYALPEKHIVGSKIFARPAPDDYIQKRKAPLFQLAPGSSVKGLYILYDEQPWPSDQEFQDPQSPFYYPSFEAARKNYIRDHVKAYGPTFYLPNACDNLIEDINCSQHYDFLLMRQSGKTFVNRIFCHGYRRAFVYWEALDINRLSQVHCVPNNGPACPGKVSEDKSYSWIYGIIVSSTENVGVTMGRMDGYVFNDLFFFGINTGMQFGCSNQYPLEDPVTGERSEINMETGQIQGFHASDYQGNGPWGEITGFKVDQCQTGIRFVWPSHLPNRVSNCMIFTAFKGSQPFTTVRGSGDLSSLSDQAAFKVEPTYSVGNNKSLRGAFYCNNTILASFNDLERFGPMAADAHTCKGRAFLLDGDIAMVFHGLQSNYPYIDDYLWAKGPHAQHASLSIFGRNINGEPMSDLILGDRD